MEKLPSELLCKSYWLQLLWVGGMINHLGCWQNAQRIHKSLACSSWFIFFITFYFLLMIYEFFLCSTNMPHGLFVNQKMFRMKLHPLSVVQGLKKHCMVYQSDILLYFLLLRSLGNNIIIIIINNNLIYWLDPKLAQHAYMFLKLEIRMCVQGTPGWSWQMS